jgi:hypothetical protein
MSDLRKMITEIVEGRQGVKGVELVTLLAVELANDSKHICSDIIMDTIDDMEKKGELVIIHYVLQSMNYRVKMFVLPKGTQVDKDWGK